MRSPCSSPHSSTRRGVTSRRHAALAAGAVLAAAAVIAAPASAGASVTSATGAVQIVDGPASVAFGAYESNTSIRVFDESQITIDKGAMPLGAGPAPAAQTVACVQSHMVHFDAIGSAHVRLSGSVTFSAAIVGVIRSNKPVGFLFRPLDLTDRLLGAQATTYAHPGDDRRGTERDDRVSIDAHDPKTLQLSLGGDGFDELRVLTPCEVPPANVPEAPLNVLLPLGGFAVVGGVLTRRRFALR